MSDIEHEIQRRRQQFIAGSEAARLCTCDHPQPYTEPDGETRCHACGRRRISPALEALAQRVADLIEERRARELTGPFDNPTRPGGRLLTTAQAAERLDVSPKWLYRRQERFGVVRVGGGPRPRIGWPEDALPDPDKE